MPYTKNINFIQLTAHQASIKAKSTTSKPINVINKIECIHKPSNIIVPINLQNPGIAFTIIVRTL
jgi:hypothetical protein